MENQTSIHLILKDVGNKIVGESRPPLMDKSFLLRHRYLDIGTVEGRMITPKIEMDKTIYLSGENAAIFLPPVFGVINMENTIVEGWYSFKGWQESEPVKMDLSTLVGSPRKTVVQIPLNVYGHGEIILEDKNKKIIASQKIHVLKLEASCPKTSLMKNEETVLNVNVKGVKDCPADYLRLKLDNVIGNSVQLGQSNHEEIIIETVNLKYSKIKWDYKAQDEKGKKAKPDIGWENYEANQFSLQRSVTALQTGGFTINIGLSYPSSVYNDPFRQQLDVLKTPEQFNNWQNALRFDNTGKHISDGVMALRLLPITSTAELDEAKSRVYNFVSWPRIGQEVIVDFLDCTLEAGKAAVENAITNVGNAPVNIEVIQSALRYVEKQATIAENKPLKDAAADILKDDFLKLQKEINDVSQQYQMLSNMQKFFYDASKATVNNMRASTDGPHPINDLIAFLDPFQKVLFVTEEKRQNVLASLRTELRPDGSYSVWGIRPDRTPVQYNIHVVNSEPQQIFYQSFLFEKKFNELLCNFQDKPDTTRGTLLTGEFWNRTTGTGTAHRYYIDAKCVLLSPAYSSSCMEGVNYDNPKISTGKSFDAEYRPVSKCRRGTDICTEKWVIYCTINNYDDANCRVLIKRWDYYDWSCY
jgi:hypothetical protein